MRKNKMMRFASGLLVAVLLTTSIISGTFAKYTSSATGNDTAKVAKWSFKVGGTDIVENNTVTFNLFNTVKEEKTTDSETHIKNTDGSIIAPGTSGSFDIVLSNESEVTAKYAISFTETNTSNVPIQYSTDGKSWTDEINTLNIKADDAKTALGFNEGDKSTKITVYWKWAYEAGNPAVKEQSDTKDTALGKDGSATVNVQANITATQVD